MKNLILILFLYFGAFSCKTSDKKMIANSETQTVANDTKHISNTELEYDIIIIEPGFSTWLLTRAKPEGFYTQNYLENKNVRYVSEWNSRVSQPTRYNSNLYEMQIDFRQGIDYGYDVNYKLYNYFVFFQNTYKQNLLGGRVPLD